MQKFYSNGKLLISGEYLVLDGAVSLALPTKYGQSLHMVETKTKSLVWKSYNVDQVCWFQLELEFTNFDIVGFDVIEGGKEKIAKTLQGILTAARSLNSSFLKNSNGVEVKTELTFPNEWGLGTSSTLINSIATWANINAFELLEKSFGGSGYDIACAQHNKAITYQRNGIHPHVVAVKFNPNFKENLFFVYLNQKQDSKEAIKMYRSLSVDKQPYINEINNLTKRLIDAQTLSDFEVLLTGHEILISNLLKVKTVKQKQFSDFKGAVKSLGAWGGDFVLVTGAKDYVLDYFNTRGFLTILPYDEMIK